MKALTDLVPLRDVAVWGGFRGAAKIPHRYGQTSGALVQYDSGRRLWVWADHASVSVDEVMIGGQPATDWAWRNAEDSTGRPITMVEFSGAVPEGEIPIARGRGKLHPRSGNLIDNAADVIWDVLANIGGQTSITEGKLASFRIACADLPVGGSVLGNLTMLAQVREVLDSIGAKFSADMRQVATLWPTTPSAARDTIDATIDLEASASRDFVHNDLTIRYAYEDGEPQSTKQFESPASIARDGRQPTTLDALWIREGRVAHAVGTRLLSHMSRRQYRIEAHGLRGFLRAGDWLTLASPIVQASGTHMVLSRRYSAATDTSDVVLQVPVGTAPTITVSESTAFAPQQYASATVSIQGADTIVRVNEPNGRPIVGAAVTLDGAVTRTTDTAGMVSFPLSLATPGEHTAIIRTADGRTWGVGVTVGMGGN